MSTWTNPVMMLRKNLASSPITLQKAYESLQLLVEKSEELTSLEKSCIKLELIKKLCDIMDIDTDANWELESQVV